MSTNTIALTIQGAVERSGRTASRTRIYEAIKAGELPSYRFGGRRTLKPHEFDAWFESKLKQDSEQGDCKMNQAKKNPALEHGAENTSVKDGYSYQVKANEPDTQADWCTVDGLEPFRDISARVVAGARNE